MAIRAELTRLNSTELTKLPDLPGKEIRFLVDHLDSRFIERRRLILEVYIQALIHLKLASETEVFMDFIGVAF